MAIRQFKWRKWNNIIHRDLGYLCVGLTVVYAVSGVAVNHTSDWNPNFKVSSVESNIGSVAATDPSSPEAVGDILSRIGETGSLRSMFRSHHDSLQLFMEDGTIVYVELSTGAVLRESVKSRTFLREANFLHLNHARKLWTYAADVYAIALAVLAVTGLFVLKGKKGITGRGAWLTGAGILVPVIFVWLYL
ncbi:MAG: PepSY-associated TM helix domain-containing protein [Gemmatimonadota bacterium]|nr:MAG: PepSY-associated TM helix domain-containing protein [Gemmatimonadota bacterium]